MTLQIFYFVNFDYYSARDHQHKENNNIIISMSSKDNNNSLFEAFEKEINDESYYQNAIKKLNKEIAPEIQEYLIKVYEHEIKELDDIKQMHIKNHQDNNNNNNNDKDDDENKRQQQIIKVEQNIQKSKQLLKKTKERFSLNDWLQNDNESKIKNSTNPTPQQQLKYKNKNGIKFNDPPPLNENNIGSIILNNMHQTITDNVTKIHQNWEQFRLQYYSVNNDDHPQIIELWKHYNALCNLIQVPKSERISISINEKNSTLSLTIPFEQ